MKISTYLRTEHIFLRTPLPDKDAVLRFVADTCAEIGLVSDADTLYDGMRKREETMSTGIGGGIGFPHTTSREARDACVILIRLAEPVDFEALDTLPVDLIIALVIPENQTALHLGILAGASRLCLKPEFLKAVRKAENPEKLFNTIVSIEDKMPFH
ncbi:MAG: PTS sugar transporter subunit IIA [Deltaproteobacteria bacterium]|nr:PTS sugar transporter subunit IIA [Deltaproteobacteria bacterium]